MGLRMRAAACSVAAAWPRTALCTAPPAAPSLASHPQVSVLRGAVCSDTFDTSAAAVERLRGTKVVCYCTAGLRSARVARTLRQAGLDAYNLEGSILGWVGGARVRDRPHGGVLPL